MSPTFFFSTHGPFCIKATISDILACQYYILTATEKTVIIECSVSTEVIFLFPANYRIKCTFKTPVDFRVKNMTHLHEKQRHWEVCTCDITEFREIPWHSSDFRGIPRNFMLILTEV
jgi:hypothetical protein